MSEDGPYARVVEDIPYAEVDLPDDGRPTTIDLGDGPEKVHPTNNLWMWWMAYFNNLRDRQPVNHTHQTYLESARKGEYENIFPLFDRVIFDYPVLAGELDVADDERYHLAQQRMSPEHSISEEELMWQRKVYSKSLDAILKIAKDEGIDIDPMVLWS